MRTSYRDIKSKVLGRIRNDTWPPGSILPTEIELAQEFDCARATVNRAMRELVDQGILERKRKAGTKVKSAPTRKAEFSISLIREEIINTGAQYRYALVDRKIIKAPSWLRALASLPSGARVLHLRCMHYADNQPYQFEDRWINLTAVADAERHGFQEIGPNDWLVQEIPYTEGELTFSATNATEEIADFLNMPEGDAVFTLKRTTWLDGQTITHARLYFSQGYTMTTSQ